MSHMPSPIKLEVVRSGYEAPYWRIEHPVNAITKHSGRVLSEVLAEIYPSPTWGDGREYAYKIAAVDEMLQALEAVKQAGPEMGTKWVSLSGLVDRAIAKAKGKRHAH